MVLFFWPLYFRPLLINTSDYPFGIFTLFNIYFLEYHKKRYIWWMSWFHTGTKFLFRNNSITVLIMFVM
jgi:hypothetical protein